MDLAKIPILFSDGPEGTLRGWAFAAVVMAVCAVILTLAQYGHAPPGLALEVGGTLAQFYVLSGIEK